MSADASIAGRRSLVDGAEQALREWLAPSRFREGDRLPTEQELAAMLGVSRGTLRGALQRLERAGEIVRRQGSGTFVARAPGSHGNGRQPLRVESYSANARRAVIEVSAVRVVLQPLHPDSALALDVGEHRESTTIDRTLRVGGRPASLTHDVFHPDVPLPSRSELWRVLFAGCSMFELMLGLGLEVSHSRTTIVPVLVEPASQSGRALELSATTACLELRELVFDSRDRPLLWARDRMGPGGLEVEVTQSREVFAPSRLGLARRAS